MHQNQSQLEAHDRYLEAGKKLEKEIRMKASKSMILGSFISGLILFPSAFILTYYNFDVINMLYPALISSIVLIGTMYKATFYQSDGRAIFTPDEEIAKPPKNQKVQDFLQAHAADRYAYFQYEKSLRSNTGPLSSVGQ